MTTEHEKHRNVLRDWLEFRTSLEFKPSSFQQAIEYLLAATEKPAIDEAVEREIASMRDAAAVLSARSYHDWACDLTDRANKLQRALKGG